MTMMKKTAYCLVTAVIYVLYAFVFAFLFKDLLDVFSESYIFRCFAAAVLLLVLDPYVTSLTVERIMPTPRVREAEAVPEEL